MGARLLSALWSWWLLRGARDVAGNRPSVSSPRLLPNCLEMICSGCRVLSIRLYGSWVDVESLTSAQRAELVHRLDVMGNGRYIVINGREVR